jgi:sigma-B regulation protein RsbQ
MILEKNNIIISYDIKENSNTTLLFVHGAFIDKDYWHSQVEFFSPSYKVVTVDMPGHGKSGKSQTPWTVQSESDNIIALVKELKLKDIILIGHSIGGDVILEVATKIPELVIGFIGIDNFKNVGVMMPNEVVEQVVSNLKSDFPNTSESFARQMLLTVNTNSNVSNRVVKSFREFDPKTGVQLISSSFSYPDKENLLMPKLKVKLYLINVDYMPTDEDLLRKYAGSGFEVYHLPGSSHYPMIENPDRFNHLLQEVISKINSNLA